MHEYAKYNYFYAFISAIAPASVLRLPMISEVNSEHVQKRKIFMSA